MGKTISTVLAAVIAITGVLPSYQAAAAPAAPRQAIDRSVPTGEALLHKTQGIPNGNPNYPMPNGGADFRERARAGGGYYGGRGYYGGSRRYYGGPRYYGGSRYYGGRRYYGRRYYRGYDPGAAAAAGVIGLAAGALAAGAIANSQRRYYGGDGSYCARRYKSYDPASGTYLGYDGRRHPCP